MLDHDTDQGQEEFEGVQGTPPKKVWLEFDPPRETALQAVSTHALRTRVDPNDPSRPSANDTVQRDSFPGVVKELLPQDDVVNLRIGQPHRSDCLRLFACAKETT
jgi:hypothetical protein